MSCLFGTSALADDLKVNRLEQEVRDLKRQVEQLSQRIEQLERSPATPATDGTATPNHLRPATPNAPWYSLENWQKVHLGTTEDEARTILGTPTTVRDTQTPGERQLFYARELKADSFLSGYLKVKDHRVTEIQVPTLK